jgi:hypothetical protein
MKNKKLVCFYLLINTFLFFNNSIAQVPVRNEPHHKIVLENDYVRILDVHINEHDTTLTHIHAAASVMVFLSNSTIGTQIAGEKPVINDVKSGATSYAAYDEKPIKHRVWNQSANLFHVMDIELVKQKPNDDSCALIDQPGIKFQWSKKLVRVYNIDISGGKQYNVLKSNCAQLLIDISGMIATASSGSVHTIKQGNFIFFPPNSDIQIAANNKENASCVLLELK